MLQLGSASVLQDNWDAAVDLFNQLKANQLGVRPNSVTYNILMSACLSQDKPQQVRHHAGMRTSAEGPPAAVSCQHASLQMALALHKLVPSVGCNIASYCMLHAGQMPGRVWRASRP